MLANTMSGLATVNRETRESPVSSDTSPWYTTVAVDVGVETGVGAADDGPDGAGDPPQAFRNTAADNSQSNSFWLFNMLVAYVAGTEGSTSKAVAYVDDAGKRPRSFRRPLAGAAYVSKRARPAFRG